MAKSIIHLQILYLPRQPNLHLIAPPIAPDIVRNSRYLLLDGFDGEAIFTHNQDRNFGLHRHHRFSQYILSGCREDGIVRQYKIPSLAIVVGSFDAIDKRSSLERHSVYIELQGVFGNDFADVHWECECHLVVFAPSSFYHRVAFFDGVSNGFAIYLDD